MAWYSDSRQLFQLLAMASEYTKLSADLPKDLMDRFRQWQINQGYTDSSQALIGILETFFSENGTLQLQDQITHLQATFEYLEAGQAEIKKEIIIYQPLVNESRIQALEAEIAELREVIQMGRGLINNQLTRLETRIERLEGGSTSSMSLVDHDDLPDDEPDEVLRDFLDPM